MPASTSRRRNDPTRPAREARRGLSTHTMPLATLLLKAHPRSRSHRRDLGVGPHGVCLHFGVSRHRSREVSELPCVHRRRQASKVIEQRVVALSILGVAALKDYCSFTCSFGDSWRKVRPIFDTNAEDLTDISLRSVADSSFSGPTPGPPSRSKRRYPSSLLLRPNPYADLALTSPTIPACVRSGGPLLILILVTRPFWM